jgi:signal peptidase I
MPNREPDRQPALSGAKPADDIRTELFFWLQALVSALVVLVLTFTFFGRIIAVDGSSMLDTLHDNDRLLLLSIGYQPRQGDIVVLTKSSFLTEPIVKRIIATEGQTVEIDYTQGTVKVDGTALDESYIREPMFDPYWDNIKSVTVPEHCVFVMGDNRNHSSDSRDPRLGVVDERYIIGKALFVIFPFSRFGAIT